ncbi:TIR domain-containing protein [Spirosoma sp.]|uniref:TIR domain-containing protein n=1 Tax=Spirosoma sp. TaxID=1899569 RepID=UPI002629B171|nr:TIR domain-containing protein [Spirosoma sp.]MCX6216626.1 TIR domain-containing protein [Spirosoma sp.]
MGRKVFVTYKYSDTKVQDLNIYEDSILYGRQRVQTKARHYVNELANILDKEDHIYKGEEDGQSLAAFSDEYISSTLRDKIYDSSITIVLISKGMKDIWKMEKDQWMPWEISYSLRAYTRNGRTSLSNGIVAVVLPDEFGSYGYYLNTDNVCNCTNYNTQFLFQILRDNMFNLKAPDTYLCSNGSIIYRGDFSYITSVKWEEFKVKPNIYLDKAIELRDKKEQYNLTKTVK